MSFVTKVNQIGELEMNNIRIPKRSERNKLIRKGAKHFHELIMLRELEQMVKVRLIEKLCITGVAFLWLIIGLFGKTVYCAMWGIPLAIITLFVGVWAM